ANVNAAPEIDKEKKQVAFTIFVDPGKRVYVRRVNVTGNTRTRDEVIRREMRQMEGGWFNSEQVNLSRERVDKLGYFSDVTVETPPVAGTSDQVDVNLNVTEKPTGNVMLGVGFSQTDKVMLSGSISQENIFGSGKHLTLGINTSKLNRNIALSYTDPYFTMNGVSQGFDLYHRRFDPEASDTLDVGDYKTESTGAGIRFGFPLSERQSINIGLAIDQTKITTYEESPRRYKDFVDEFGKSNITLPFTASWTSDGKDSYIFPTKGTYQRVSAEIALPGGDLQYWKLNYKFQHYVPLSKSITLMFNADLGIGNGYGSNENLPFYKNFYAGGIDSVRGYAAASLGPLADDRYDDEHMGGNRKVVGNVELLWGVPGYDKSMRMGWFFDAGQVYNKGRKYDYDDSMRMSTGLSLSWVSPVGPLKLSIAAPINKKKGDDTETFQFQLGSTF
ncbi:MAG: outer membrane protein assembly factor BamA, partial [Zoogloeaceae bacterium]|nr:outer membrane protein assembly factor BamA [Zoogloeaceae bacterium]